MTEETQDELPAKRAKWSTRKQQWIVFDPVLYTKRFQTGDHVFVRSKSTAQLGQRGRLLDHAPSDRWNIQFECGEQKSVCRKRLLPVYSTPSPGVVKVVITGDTVHYRQLAASQLQKSDAVLELGCSTGETSKAIWKYANSWIGMDTSVDMINSTRKQLDLAQSSRCSFCSARCEQIDPLNDPDAAESAVRRHHQDTTTVVFIDIGGNREQEAVVRVLHWVLQSFLNLRFVIIKSQKLFKNLRPKADEGGSIPCGDEWFAEKLEEAWVYPKHPLQAPKVYSPNDASMAICRYHNYHSKGCLKGPSCPFDHMHCHACLQAGHIARECPIVEERLKQRAGTSRDTNEVNFQ